jgi:polar amino acid transport system substrate-binding protein
MITPKCFILTILGLALTLNIYAIDNITVASGQSGVGWSEYAKHNGYMIHLTTEAFAAVGIRVKLVLLPWKRAFNDAKFVRVDATCCWFFVENRARQFYYSDPIFEETMVFFHLKSFRFDWKDMNDLAGITSGGNIGFHYGDAFQKAEKEGRIKVERTKNNELNLKKLLAGRINVHPIATITAYGYFQKLFTQNEIELLTFHPRPLLTKNLHLIISKKMDPQKAESIITDFNQGLKIIKKSGKHQEITRKAESGYYELMEEKWSE